jgi:CubicO group peptidase (beta-lactamase class C family)
VAARNPSSFVLALTLGGALAVAVESVSFLEAQGGIPVELQAARRSLQAAIERGAAPSMTVAVARGGHIVWNEAFGWADRDHRRRATTETPYSIASVTKPFTATAIMLLAERGELSLDDPISTHTPIERPGVRSSAEVTIRRTLNHTAGFPVHYQYFYEDQPTRPATFEATMRCFGAEIGPPGLRYTYSNLGYEALRAVVEGASGGAFGDFLARELFRPLSMQHTSVVERPSQAAEAAVRYGTDGVPLPFYWTDHAGASAIYATAADLVRFGQFHAGVEFGGARVLTRESVAAMQEPGLGNYGLGWSINPDWHGRRVVYHSGAMPGAAATLWIVPSEQVSIAIVANRFGAPVNQIAGDILQGILGTSGVPTDVPAVEEAPGTEPELPGDDPHGRWHGRWSTCPEAESVEFDIRAPGDVTVSIAGDIPLRVESVVISRGLLTGTIAASPRVTYRLSLRARDGRLEGPVVKRVSLGPRGTTSVTLWAQMTQ